jgi:cbb3-type cytochrome oxidase subunit 1
MGTIMTLVPVYNFVMLSTLFTRAHAHLSLIGWVSFAIIGFMYLGLEYFNKHMNSEKLGFCGFWLFNIGMFVEFVTLTVGGYYQARSVLNGDIYSYMHTVQYTMFTIIFAFVMLIGAYMTIYNIYKTLNSD